MQIFKSLSLSKQELRRGAQCCPPPRYYKGPKSPVLIGLKNAGQPASFAVALCWALLYVRCHMKMAAAVKRQIGTRAKDAGWPAFFKHLSSNKKPNEKNVKYILTPLVERDRSFLNNFVTVLTLFGFKFPKTSFAWNIRAAFCETKRLDLRWKWHYIKT